MSGRNICADCGYDEFYRDGVCINCHGTVRKATEAAVTDLLNVEWAEMQRLHYEEQKRATAVLYRDGVAQALASGAGDGSYHGVYLKPDEPTLLYSTDGIAAELYRARAQRNDAEMIRTETVWVPEPVMCSVEYALKHLAKRLGFDPERVVDIEPHPKFAGYHICKLQEAPRVKR